ncbi:MAG: DUF805 domain-containing protein [Candidatus Parcubacteria bacterium]|nr:DUF805 domain-containing protein [Candidatus Parcubacteria bacterium]
MTYLLNKIIDAFKGTINRKNFFFGVMIDGAVIVVLGWCIVTLYATNRGINLVFLTLLLVLTLLGVISQIFLFSLIVRRLHDLNMSGWRSLFLFVPIINIFFGLYLFLFPRKNETRDSRNKHLEQPKQ